MGHPSARWAPLLTVVDPVAISNAQIKAALKSSSGIAAHAAERLQTSRQNIWQRIQRSTELQMYIAEIEQNIIDQAEAIVLVAMNERQLDSKKPTKEAVRISQWMLDRKGRGRGYSTRTELTGPDGAPLPGPAAPVVNINVRYVDAPPVDEDVV